jgi:hypothetical protein
MSAIAQWVSGSLTGYIAPCVNKVRSAVPLADYTAQQIELYVPAAILTLDKYIDTGGERTIGAGLTEDAFGKGDVVDACVAQHRVSRCQREVASPLGLRRVTTFRALPTFAFDDNFWCDELSESDDDMDDDSSSVDRAAALWSLRVQSGMHVSSPTVCGNILSRIPNVLFLTKVAAECVSLPVLEVGSWIIELTLAQKTKLANSIATGTCRLTTKVESLSPVSVVLIINGCTKYARLASAYLALVRPTRRCSS